MTRTSTVVSVRLNNALVAAMKEFAAETGVPQSQQMKRALVAFFEARDGEFKSLRKRIAAKLDGGK